MPRSLEGNVIEMFSRIRSTPTRRELAGRLHQLEVDLLKLDLDVRQLEQNIIEADVAELQSRFGQRAPRPPDLAS